MARRRRNWEELKADYQARLSRHGITPSYYEQGGNLQLARGHKYKREHIIRFERNPKSLTSADYSFLKNQQRRAKKEDFSSSIAAYKRLSPRQRRDLRARVTSMHREYKRQKSVSGKVLGEGTAPLREEFRRVFSSGGGGGEDVEYEDDFPDVDDFYYDFDEYEDDFPDFDDDLKALLFYH